MTTLIELTQRIFFFEGVAFVLLSAIVVSRWFFRQPIDRIRLTQLGFGLIAVAAVCIGCGIGPTWTITLPERDGRLQTADGSREEQIAENIEPASEPQPGLCITSVTSCNKS